MAFSKEDIFMYQKEATVKSATGLHARPATIITKTAAEFKSKVTIEYKSKSIDARSIMGLLAAAISGGEKVTIRAEGNDEKAAVDKIAELVETIEG